MLEATAKTILWYTPIQVLRFVGQIFGFLVALVIMLIALGAYVYHNLEFGADNEMLPNFCQRKIEIIEEKE